jgi:serine/threonine protein kinase
VSRNREFYLRTIESRSLLEGRYSNLTRLGPSGGDGTFSLLVSAEDARTRQEVALKFFSPDCRTDAYRWESFKRESELLQGFVGEPDVVQLVAPVAEFTETVSIPGSGLSLDIPFSFYAVELASHDVATQIAKRTWEAEQLLLAFRSMCRAVRRVHAARIVYRDLKPSNFLVMPNGDVKLADFGTARLLDGIRPGIANAYFGPPGDMRYVPPEMMALLHESEPDTAYRADFFGLGSILFELFTGIVLGPLLFDPGFITDLVTSMNAVPTRDRRRVYNQFVDAIANRRRLPSLQRFSSQVPGCIRTQVEELYKCLAAIDYRKRMCDFERIFYKVNVCLIILRNETKYRRWLNEKQKRRLAAQEKKQRLLRGVL